MFLNDRKIRILEAIINDYIVTAEPVGSRTIAKKYEMGISSATIRNEMSDLEEMGFIMQTHASSGRVPSDKGYRLYVDSLMRSRQLTAAESDYLQQMVINNINKIDYLMRETAKAISYLTHYTTVVTEPRVKEATIKHTQLVPLDENSVLLVLINDSKAVVNHVIRAGKAPEPDSLNRLSAVLNKHLCGLSVNMLNDRLVNKMSAEFGEYKQLLRPVIEAIADSLNRGEETKLYTSGIKNILAFPEFNDLDKAKSIFETLEEKDMLITLISDNNNQGQGQDYDKNQLEIVIGSENKIIHMRDCSIIKASYRLNDTTRGNIGIIGPTRMDYSQVIAVLDGIVSKISAVLEQFDDS